MRNKRQEYPLLEQVLILDAGAEGKAVGKVDGKVVFVPYAMPGDVVDVQVTNKRKGFMEGRVVKYHKRSDDFREPFCEHFGLCGGCKWQHMPYALQLWYKEKQVVDNLQRLGGLTAGTVRPILGAPDERFYRNKLEYTFSSRRWLTDPRPKNDLPHTKGLGFHLPGMFDRILDIEHCYLQADPSNEIRLAVRDFAIENGFTFYDPREQHGLLRNLIIRNTTSGQWMVIVVFHQKDQDAIDTLLGFIRERFPFLHSIIYVINNKVNDAIGDQKLRLFAGSDHLIEEMGGLKFRIGPKSFFQTNSVQALHLYETVRDYCGLSGEEVVYDLYTGTGTIALFLASGAKKVVGVEYVEEAVADAKVNAELNGVGNADFVAGDLGKMFDQRFVEAHGHPDVIVTDPPRAGMHPRVVERILALRPTRIVYVSCNPATQARDLALLTGDYELREIQPVDMFPQTHHVENVALLVRKEKTANVSAS
ncbi:MAG TPA: 23S rRNA (uracil(1939)-C(5))-methyltransferase RlmD [Bacteroidales bacterium]|nr:23S rRNA (uracil(1939)-C(5))-methyltransferase RlmD [Bacteroidales bacterium]